MGHDLTYIMRVIMAHICKKCFLREMAEEDAKMIEKYKKGIKETDRVSEKKYEERLAAKNVICLMLGLVVLADVM